MNHFSAKKNNSLVNYDLLCDFRQYIVLPVSLFVSLQIKWYINVNNSVVPIIWNIF